MKIKTKAILKTIGIIAASAVAYAYLPLVSFAAFPEFTAWLHIGLATIHPLLGEVLLGTGILYGATTVINKIWKNYFFEKKLENKVKKILEQQKCRPSQETNEKSNEKEYMHQISENLKLPIHQKESAPQEQSLKKESVKAHHLGLKKIALKNAKDYSQKEAA